MRMSARRRTGRLDSEFKRPDGKGESIHIERLVLGMVQTNCYLIENRKLGLAVVIDPAAEMEIIRQDLEEKKLKPAAVLLTHGHFDHGLAADDLAKAYGVDIGVGEKEASLLADVHKTASFLIPGVAYTLKPDRLFADGEELELAGIRIRVLATPGHTEGSVSYYLPDYQVVFSGDTLFCGSVGRTDFPTGDMGTLLRSLRHVLLELPNGTIVLPGHGGSTTVELERRYNPYLEESGFWE